MSNALLITATEDGSALHLPIDPRQVGVLAILILFVVLTTAAFFAMSQGDRIKKWRDWQAKAGYVPPAARE